MATWMIDNAGETRTMFLGVRLVLTTLPTRDEDWKITPPGDGEYAVRLGSRSGRVIGLGIRKADAVRQAKAWVRENY
jgi:hypothetical protein